VHAQGTDPWAAGQGAWPTLPPLEQAHSSASAGREASGDAGEQKPGRRQQQQQGFDHEQLQSPRNGGGSDGAPKSARQRRLEINRRSQTLYRERQKVRMNCLPQARDGGCLSRRGYEVGPLQLARSRIIQSGLHAPRPSPSPRVCTPHLPKSYPQPRLGSRYLSLVFAPEHNIMQRNQQLYGRARADRPRVGSTRRRSRGGWRPQTWC